MYIHLEKDDTVDPRVLRTRELLINSFAKLLIEHQSMRKVSVQSIAHNAGVNRVTFYAHFTDKYELLDVWMRLLFKQEVGEKLPTDGQLNKQNLEVLIDASLEFLFVRNKYRKRINEQFEPMLEAATQQELKNVLRMLLQNTVDLQPSLALSSDTLTTFLSWAIFGTALAWSRAPKGQTKQAMTAQLVGMCDAVINHGSL